jgi:hypothetical protein
VNKYAQYTCHAVDGRLVDYYHAPKKPRLGQQILLQDRRRHDWPVVEFEVVCIQNRELTIEEVDES